ncbi:MAG: DNA-3-methyladenine glycosylase 2 family protein [Bacteroidota bacterium]|nr:DNA-3-methyladenine glycosylase 2 family protein [Bacteroidota bacterium]
MDKNNIKNIVNQKDLKKLFKADRIFIEIHGQYGSPPDWQRPQGFITLSRIILGQLVSLESANAHFFKLNNFLPAFSPEEILKLSDEEMRTCYISRQKSNHLRALSSAILDRKIDLDMLPALSPSEVRNQLKAIKGIGDWTADIYLMFSLQSKDIFPMGDVAVINTIKELCNVVTKNEIAKRSEKWKPLRSLATFFLWHYYLNKRKRNFV